MSNTYQRYYREHLRTHIHNRDRNYVLETNCPYCKRARRWLYHYRLTENMNRNRPRNSNRNSNRHINTNRTHIANTHSLNTILQIRGLNNHELSYENISTLSPVDVKTTLEEIMSNTTIDIKDNNSHTLCVICRDTIKQNDIIRKIKCSHYFHVNCIDQWLINHKTCPLCKFNL